MRKYIYYVVDQADAVITVSRTRDEARRDKRFFEDFPLSTDKPPFKIVRYELTNPKVVR